MIAKLCGEYLKIGFPGQWNSSVQCCRGLLRAIFARLNIVNNRQIDPIGFRDPTIDQISNDSPEDRSVLGGGNLRRR